MTSMMGSNNRSKRARLVRCFICNGAGHIAKFCFWHHRQEWSRGDESGVMAILDPPPGAWGRNRGFTPDRDSGATEYGTPLQSDPEDGGGVSPRLGIGEVRATELNTEGEDVIGFSELFDGEKKDTLNGRGSDIASAGTIRC